jgi:large subunit ribosomal protein L3
MIGLIGKKVGMTQVFDESGVLTPVTVIQIEPNVVLNQRTEEKNGYSAVVLGAIDMKKSRVTKPYAGQFPEGIEPKKYLREMRDFDLDVSVGGSVGVEIFQETRFVDIIGVSKGKGFQGVMKRYGFGGGRKTHGSKFHRAHGSTGQNTTPGRGLKGVKMAGRMGGERTTVQNLKVVRVDTDKKVLLVKGAVPGTRNGIVVVRAAKKKG